MRPALVGWNDQGILNSPMAPPSSGSVNHMVPAGPAAMPNGSTDCFAPDSVMAPVDEIRAILWPRLSVNQRFPSAPVTMPTGELPAVEITNSPVITPAVVIRPILLPVCSVNHTFPSGPVVMAHGELLLVGIGTPW